MSKSKPKCATQTEAIDVNVPSASSNTVISGGSITGYSAISSVKSQKQEKSSD